MSKEINLTIVDDHPLLLEGLTSTLESVETYRVIGTGGSYTDAIEIAKNLMPDVMLLDISMPGGGLEAAQHIRDNYPNIILIMLTVSEDENDLKSALQIGVEAYILKGVGGNELISIIKRVTAGETFITPSLANSILSHSYSERPNPISRLLDTLNERELTIMEGLRRGLTNKQIAEELFLSEKTIKHYMTSILQKLQVKNRVQAALLAQESHGVD